MRFHKRNSVYRNTEKNLMKALSKILTKKHSINISAREVSRGANLYHTSLYVHYRSLSDLLEKNEQRISGIVDEAILEQKKHSDLSQESRFRHVLIKLIQEQDFLEVLAKSKNSEILGNILVHFKPLITDGWAQYGDDINDALLNIVISNFIAETYLWADEGFTIDAVPRHAHNFAYFSINAPRFYAGIYYRKPTNSVQPTT